MSAIVPGAEERAQGYLAFARAFDHPCPELWDRAEGGRFGELAREVWSVEGSSKDADVVIPRRTQEEREAEYVSAFELGGVPLYEGLHRRDEGREGILEDLLRFYGFFDVRLREDGRDYPDHLVTELEFMGYLAAREAQAEQAGADSSSYRRAQRDFLARHLGVWLPLLEERTARVLRSSAYWPLVEVLGAFVVAHRRELDLSVEGE